MDQTLLEAVHQEDMHTGVSYLIKWISESHAWPCVFHTIQMQISGHSLGQDRSNKTAFEGAIKLFVTYLKMCSYRKTHNS